MESPDKCDCCPMTNVLALSVNELRASLPILLTVAETAEVARCSPSSVRRAINGGRLPFNQREGGGAIYIPRDAVLEWAFSLNVSGAASRGRDASRSLARADRSMTSGEPRQRRAPLRASVRGRAPERLTPEAMRDFAAAYRG